MYLNLFDDEAFSLQHRDPGNQWALEMAKFNLVNKNLNGRGDFIIERKQPCRLLKKIVHLYFEIRNIVFEFIG